MALMEYKKNGKLIERANSHSEPVLKKHVGLIHCENKLSFLQRKICNVFLFHALDGIENKEIHQIPLNQLCSLIGYRSNDIHLIKKSIKGLISTIMEWNLLDDSKFLNEANFSKDAVSWNASALLAGASIERGVISYSYSPQIKSVLSSLEIYGRINLFVQAKFNSNYSLVLYENCIRFKNISKTAWFKLDLFRSLMGLIGKKYESFKELKRNVITIAIDEINKKSDIKVEPEYRKVGRTITSIRFLIFENENYKPAFKRAPRSLDVTVNHELTHSSLLAILASDFGMQEKQAQGLLLNYSADYMAEKIALVKRSKKIEKPGAYLVAALKNDYKENEKIRRDKQESRGVINTYQRETSEASQVRSLKKKYVQYKFDQYIKYFSERKIEDTIRTEFIKNMTNTNQIMGELYQKKGIHSLPAMMEFIEYADKNYQNHGIDFLNFEEYISEEEVV
jgi:hypothetical protein